MNSWLLLSLLTAHIVGDFYLQSDKRTVENQKSVSLYSFSCRRFIFLGFCPVY